MINQQSVQIRKIALEVRNLRVSFHTYAGTVKALDGVDIQLFEREVLGLVGESGCGKTVTALAIAGLLPGNATVEEGEVILDGQDLLKQSKNRMRIERLQDIALVFQDPATYLNPLMTIGNQITEVFEGNLKLFKDELIQSRLDSISKNLGSGAGNADLAQLEKERRETLGNQGRREAEQRERGKDSPNNLRWSTSNWSDFPILKS